MNKREFAKKNRLKIKMVDKLLEDGIINIVDGKVIADQKKILHCNSCNKSNGCRVGKDGILEYSSAVYHNILKETV